MISIVIPLYNKEDMVVQTLESVLGQTFSDFEIILVDDGSTDASVERVLSVKDSRVRLIRQANGGVSAARNRGIEEARGEWIAFLDADDIWKPDYLSEMMRLADKYPECGVLACRYEMQDSKGKITPIILNKIKFEGTDGVMDNYFEVASCSNPPVCSSTTIVKKQEMEKIGGFPIGVKAGEDMLTWASLAVITKIAFNNRALAYFVYDEEIFNDDQKKRDVSLDDLVGSELKKLYNEYATPGLKEYIALWYKMRARICITKNFRKQALQQVIQSIKYSFNFKIATFGIMCFLPHSLNIKLFKKFS